MGEQRWRERAACRPGTGVDPELFFPTAEAGPAWERQVAAARAVCAGCPVRVACLADAVARIPYGVAGGLTEAERRRLRRSTTVASARSGAGDVESGLGVDVLLAASHANEPDHRPTAGITRAGRAGVGRALFAGGRTPRQVAQLCGVTTRTAERWAARLTCSTSTSTAGEESRGGNRAPLRTSTARHAWADETTPEGHRG